MTAISTLKLSTITFTDKSPLIEQTAEVMTSFANSIETTLFNLYCRWQDEKEYEDFADYINVAKTLPMPQGMKFVKLTKRPFAMHVSLDTRPGVTFSVFVGGRGFGWKKN